MTHDRTCACAECLEREETEYRAWQQTDEGQDTAAYFARRAANGFLPRDPNPELDALLKKEAICQKND